MSTLRKYRNEIDYENTHPYNIYALSKAKAQEAYRTFTDISKELGE